MGIVIRSDVEVPLLVEVSIGYDDVAVGIETEKVAECLDNVTMRDGDGKIIQKPFTKRDHPFLMTRWAKVTTLAGEGDQAPPGMRVRTGRFDRIAG